MAKPPSSRHAASVVAAFVRGEISWRDLESLGLQIVFSDDGCVVEGSAGAVVEPTPKDVSTGLLALATGPPAELHRWAALILAGSSFLDLSPLERDEDGEALLEGLWDLSAREPVRWQLLALAKKLAGGAD